MIKFLIKLLLNGLITLTIVAGVAATGWTVDTAEMAPGGNRMGAELWNRMATTMHGFVADHDTQLEGLSREAAVGAGDLSVESVLKLSEYVEANRSELEAMAEKAGIDLNEALNAPRR